MMHKDIPASKMRRKEPIFKNRLILGNDQSAIPIGAQRIASISKDMMEDAGIDTKVCKAHAIRGAAATAQIDHGESVDDVMYRGRWRSQSVFRAFYERAQRRVQMPSDFMKAMLSRCIS